MSIYMTGFLHFSYVQMSTPNDKEVHDVQNQDEFSTIVDIPEEMRAQVLAMLSAAPAPLSEMDLTAYKEEIEVATAAADAVGAEGPWANLEDVR